ncbi:16S rRNA m(7)G-527 methyltransferase [Desulfurobacterium pacificum]|uniref:Ribosomal RNA small subunit methyltransferase G n=1 Tax=Desulfurobacterium pacificum TaxID=240166 RepID=A0ABY1NIF7_9BACT|nr:16S rRNA (guanine(527)-N(7))-methyltransferase RsmG [Desulfurobacterium pacificum]SMP10637.1 16S rRNA m(7)G-527 methyltransferase [Desulfurobacterium pacificum]
MKRLKELCSLNGIEIEDICLNQFEKYKELLKKWGRRINLTSLLSDEEIEVKHFFDSLLGLKAFEEAGLSISEKRFCDVGSGAGFPGIPLAIVVKSSFFSLIESRHKRCVFLEQVKRELKLENVKVFCQRIEEHYGDYDYLLMRAVKDPETAVEMTSQFLEEGAVLCIYRGREKFEGEIPGYEVEEVVLKPEGVDFTRRFLFIKKV